MSVLSVSQDGETFQHFYLDKTVCIKPQIQFSLTSFKGDSTVYLSARVAPEMLGSRGSDSLRIENQVRVEGLYTFFYQEKEQGFFFPGESHSMAELTYVDQGTVHSVADGKDLLLEQGDMVLYAPDQWHMQYADEDVRFITISFSWEGHDFSSLINRTFTLSTAAQHSIHSLLHAYEQDTPDHDEYLYIQTQLLPLQIFRTPTHSAQAKTPSPASELAHQRTIDQAMQTVSEHVYDKLSVSDLAGLVNVSTSQLTFLFRNYLNTTPGKYITRVRLEESKTLLSEKRKSIGEVAAQLGYASIQHFSKQFHDWYGCSPSAYVRQNKASHL
jgi:AraC-like DNA-binding protein